METQKESLNTLGAKSENVSIPPRPDAPDDTSILIISPVIASILKFILKFGGGLFLISFLIGISDNLTLNNPSELVFFIFIATVMVVSYVVVIRILKDITQKKKEVPHQELEFQESKFQKSKPEGTSKETGVYVSQEFSVNFNANLFVFLSWFGMILMLPLGSGWEVIFYGPFIFVFFTTFLVVFNSIFKKMKSNAFTIFSTLVFILLTFISVRINFWIVTDGEYPSFTLPYHLGAEDAYYAGNWVFRVLLLSSILYFMIGSKKLIDKIRANSNLTLSQAGKLLLVLIMLIGIHVGYVYMTIDEARVFEDPQYAHLTNRAPSEKDVVSWVTISKDLGQNRILTIQAPAEYEDRISAEVINKKVDTQPENFALSTIGGAVDEERDIFILGKDGSVSYSFVTATNYKWRMIEVPFDSNSHLEVGISFKDADDEVSVLEWDRMISTIRIK